MNPVDLEKLILTNLKGPTSKAAFIARYTGGVGHKDRKVDEISRMRFLGHSLIIHRKFISKYSDIACKLEARKEWQLWIDLWKQTSVYDVRSICLMWFAHKKNVSRRRLYSKDLFDLAIDIDNWALCDGLSSMLAQILEENPEKFVQFKKWNSSKNPWLRRQSLVGIYYYTRLRKKPYPVRDTLKLIERLLEDPHYYVQKSVGWTLREIDRIDSRLQKSFVRRNLTRISSVAWYAASELYPEKLKLELVQKRRLIRSK